MSSVTPPIHKVVMDISSGGGTLKPLSLFTVDCFFKEISGNEEYEITVIKRKFNPPSSSPLPKIENNPTMQEILNGKN